MSVPVFDLNSAILSSIGLTLTQVLVLLIFGAYQQRSLIMHWVRGLLVFGFGLAVYFISVTSFVHGRHSVYIAASVTIISLGISLFVNGVRLLRGYRIYRYRSLVVVTSMLAGNAIMLNMYAPERWVLLFNLTALMWVFAHGTRSLIGHGKDFIAHVYWLCCSLFASITLMLAVLWVKLTLSETSALQTFSQWSTHAYMLLAIMLIISSVTSLLLLVMHVRAQAGLQAIATMDGLTGVLNRRGLQEAATRMQSVSQRLRLPMGMLMVDLDYFKKVNDVYGHLVGDVVLKSCAGTIRAALRGGDVIGRYGGEEFCILMPNTGEHEAMILAERIRRIIEETPVNVAGVESMSNETQAIKCTVSVGSVSSETVGYALEGLFSAADQNLYKAKTNGRNRIISNVDALLAKPTEEGKPAKRHASLIA